MTDPTPDLLPCPFCGGPGKRSTDGVWCDGVPFNRHTMIVLRKEEWNTRTQTPATNAAAKEVMK